MLNCLQVVIRDSAVVQLTFVMILRVEKWRTFKKHHSAMTGAFHRNRTLETGNIISFAITAGSWG